MLIQFPSYRQVEIPELDYLCPNGECQYTDEFGNDNHPPCYQINLKHSLPPLDRLFNVIKNLFMANFDEHFAEYPPFSNLLSPRSLEYFFLIGNRTPQGRYRLEKDRISDHRYTQGKHRNTILKQLRILSTPLHRDYQRTLTMFHSRSNYSWFANLFMVKTDDNTLIDKYFKNTYGYFRGFFLPFINSSITLDLIRSRSFFDNSIHGYKELLDLLEHMNKMYLNKNENFIKTVNIIFDKFNEDDKISLMRFQRDY